MLLGQPEFRRTISRKSLEQLRQSRTTFMIAHRIQTVMRADNIVVLDKGRIIQQGTHRQLIAEDGVYRTIYQLQAKVEEEMSSTNGRTPEPSYEHVTA